MDENNGFVLIGAGLPRTGTMSSRIALEELLKGDVYHMVTLLNERPDHLPHWKKALRKETSVEDWQDVMGSYRGGVDFPISLYYQELMEAFPNAKVLLSIRDPVKWYNSVKNSILRANNEMTSWPGSWYFYMMGKAKFFNVCRQICRSPIKDSQLGLGMFQAVELGEEAAVQFYHEHVNQVKSIVPADRLLVWEVSEGWQPLCDFLGVPVPDHPFPRVNDTVSMEQRRKKMATVSWLMIVVIPLALVFVSWLYAFSSPAPYVCMVVGYALLIAIQASFLSFMKNFDTKKKKE